MDRWQMVRLVCPSLIIIIFFLFSCSEKRPNTITRAYYFWRTNEPTFKEKKFLKEHHIQKLYIHLMDVDWSELNGPIPVTNNELQLTNSVLESYEGFPNQLVPVVFITNKTFERIDSIYIPLLAKRLVRRCLPAFDYTDKDYEIRHGFSTYHGAISPKEIQFDCDWTSKTKTRYFNFLLEVKKLLPETVKLSVTIRLHQFKYPTKTGVPPVDQGMLMVYNISDPKKYSPKNSIFDKDQAEDYFTSGSRYPLPLHIVLPTWSWCIIYRNNEFYQVENQLTEKDLQKASFLNPIGNHFYAVLKDTVYHDLFLRPGDHIKAEQIDKNELREAIKLSKKAINTDSFTVSLFELSQKEFQNFSHEDIDKAYDAFR